MNKILHIMLSAAMLLGMGVLTNANAQTNPCGWTLDIAITDPSCPGACDGSITLTPNFSLIYFEFMWADGSTGNTLNNVCGEDYTVTITDDKKCTAVYTISVGDPEPVVAACTTLTNESAPGAADGSITASATGGSGIYEYQWNTNPVQYGPTATGLTAGVYTVTITDDKKCVSTATCEIITEKKEECEGFRTQTQGGWGQCQQNGNNPGSYLFNNFAAAFPNGLTIGCTNTLSLSSAQAVCDFLPSGSTPVALPAGNMSDPGAAYTNVLAGQLVAATLNAGFDVYDPNFASNSDFTLGDLIIVSGPFMGWSVNDLLTEANNKIGGCTSAYSYSKINKALSMINQNYTDGAVDNGFLTCPEEKKDRIAADQSFTVSVAPNPANGVTKVMIYSDVKDQAQAHIFNINGQKVATLFNGTVEAGEYHQLTFDANEFQSGIYMIQVVTSNKIANQKIIIKN
jgi:hypothetical protein